MLEDSKVYFLPGDVVTLKQDIPNKPTMIVIKKVTSTFKNENTKDEFFRGILCRWFTSEGVIQEAIYNTKDIQKV